MIVVGGCYREICTIPHWDRILGSGGRAAIGLSSWTDVTLHTYVSARYAKDAKATFGAFGINAIIEQTPETLSFFYFHPLSRSILNPPLPERQPALRVSGKEILRFSFVEGDAIIDGGRVVYDPQGRGADSQFYENGSKAEELAVVLNDVEARQMAKVNNLSEAAYSLFQKDSSLRVIVIKCGPLGSSVYERDGKLASIPAYQADTVFKIGSGDVFSAAFAHQWSERGLSAPAAADIASRATAAYVQSASLPFEQQGELSSLKELRTGSIGQVYLAAPFFTTAQLWLVEELMHSLETLGAKVFSPFHKVGSNYNSKEIASKDLAGLAESSAVLAVIDGHDPGTIFEVGYARDRNIPVVALTENVAEGNLTMLDGSGCSIVRDLSSAVYQTIWAAIK